jgi:DNA-binding transcriptional LysR family regulator
VFDWDDLRFLLAVGRAGSTLAAAKLLAVNQSTVHRRLTAFEERIGRKLVERHATGYRLTELGTQLLPYAESVEDAVAAFERQLDARDIELTGRIRVTCPEGLFELLTPLVASFQARYPALHVDLLATERMLDLAKGQAEIAVRAGDPRDSALVGRKIADNPWAVFAGRSYIETHGRPKQPVDLNHHTIVDLEGEIASVGPAKWLHAIAPQARIAARSTTVLGLLMSAKSGVGIAVLPIHIGNADDNLVRIFDPVPDLMTHIYLLVHPDLRQTPRVRAFFDFVVAEIAAFRPMLLGESPGAHNPKH